MVQLIAQGHTDWRRPYSFGVLSIGAGGSVRFRLIGAGLRQLLVFGLMVGSLEQEAASLVWTDWRRV